ncbi:hypothetical protein SD37_40760 [Amycolatopsis orientalis]|uniref:Uncharacterized protein n=1 Tax=Amycolatopsis orientalis TaxID=31958 RepID=A0A193CAE3_AMYOR|nr:hypothetical protein [Amycolatopsis orientalis]ANN21285.1 hypothetical protein SD37_40760 [Amycolatopsis orientalis]
MTDLETLRSALREPPAEGFAAPDLAAIMTKGRRIRRRRRLATGAGGVAAAVVTVLVIVGAVALKEPPPAEQPLPPAASAPGPASTSTSAPPETPAPAATSAPSDPPLGDVISLGIRGDGGRPLVLYAVAIDEPTLPGIRFGLQVGYSNDDGTYEGLQSTNEFKGSDRSFGFHATDGGDLVQDTFVPVFGYFAGPAARIAGTVRGKPVNAKTAVWSEDPSIVFYWFDPADVGSANVLSPLIAYDAKGQRLTK